MSDSDRQTEVRVRDRRRFDAEGNPRPEEATGETPAQAEPELPAEGVPAPEVRPDEVSALQAELDAARRRVDELARAYQAQLQDREEFKRRLSREQERMVEVEKGNVAQILLEAVDELDLCLKASEQDTSPLATGVRLIRESMLSKLAAAGVERLELVGEPFDPNQAEAADMEVTSEPEQDQRVVAELRAGYRLKGRVIRPARVKVAKYVKPAEA